jgi:putative integral membrane protein (TIGR02587 family)
VAKLTNETQRFVKGLVRAVAGAAIVGLPLALTMEMWWLGFVMERWKLALLVGSTLPTVMFLSHFSGFSGQGHWKETILDGFVVFLVGLAFAPLLLFLFGQITSEIPFEEILGKIVIQAVPASIGAAIARSLLEAKGDEEDEKKHRVSKPREIFLRVVGALVLGFDIAPTDEMTRIAEETRPWHMLGLVALCILIMHAFARGLEQKAHGSVPRRMGQGRLLFTTSLPGYATALAVSAYLLWLFGRFEGAGLEQIVATIVVLGLPATLGAAAVRILL